MVIKKSINNFISKGGTSYSSHKGEFCNILLRIPNTVLDDLDKLLKEKPWINRTSWIIEAIDLRLKSDG